MCMVFPPIYVVFSRSGYVKFDDSVGKFSSDDSELRPDEVGLFEVGAPRGLIF